MKVLSLFDGISCGMVALERVGIHVEKYTAYEIEEDAIEISKHNYPMIEQKGDVFNAEYTEGEYDLLIGGSPCTYWSIAKTDGKRETTSSGFGFELFMQYVRALKEAKPKYFLYENNFSINQNIKDEITKQLGVEPIMINSGLVSAQNRKRMYWTNIPGVKQPEDKGLKLYDVIDFSKETFRPIGKWVWKYWGDKRKIDMLKTINSEKSHTLTTSATHSMGYYLDEDKTHYCTLSVNAWEKLQTLPLGYVDNANVKKTSKYRGIGNGWTVDVIAHIFTHIPKEERNEAEMHLEDNLDRFERYDAEREAQLHKQPVCCYCDEHIQSDHIYLINDEIICPDCLEAHFRKDIEDYIE